MRGAAWLEHNSSNFTVRSRALALRVVAVSLLVACGGGDENSDVASVDIVPKEPMVEIGRTIQLHAIARDAAGDELSGKTFTWEAGYLSDNITVNDDGEVTGLSEGVGVVYVSCEKKETLVHVWVVQSGTLDAGEPDQDAGVTNHDGGGQVEPARPIDRVEVSPDHVEIVAGDTLQLTASLFDADGNSIERPESISWKSSNAKVARVGAQGVVEVLKEGSATITASAEGKQATANLKSYAAQDGMITAGGSHACGVTRFGHAYCWGMDGDGSIGIGDHWPTFMTDDHVIHDVQCEPAEVAGGRLFRSLSAGANHTCGITVSGETYCWGMLTALGDGELHALSSDTISPTATSPIAVKGDLKFASISSGWDYTCAVTTDGKGYCWGNSLADGRLSGRLGNGTRDPEALPTEVAGNHHWKEIRASGTLTVGLDTDGHAFQWGILGSLDVVEPTPVPGDHVFAAISVSGSRVLALDTDGKAWGWGSNQFGSIGDGTTIEREEPTAVAGNHTFKALAIGGSSAAVGDDGMLYWWGHFQVSGGLDSAFNGTDRSQDYLEPYALGVLDAEQLVSGGYYVLGATADGTMYGIGVNDDGQLGFGCESLATAEHVGTKSAYYELEVGGTDLPIDSGGTATVPITVKRYGGFSLGGIGFSKDIALEVVSSGDDVPVDATIEPSVLKPGADRATLSIVVPETGYGFTTSIGVSASAEGDTEGDQAHNAPINLAVSSEQASGTTLELQCPAESGVLPHLQGSPNRYQCMEAQAGVQAPGQYAGDANFQRLTQHVWVEQSVGVCVYWGHDYAGNSTPSRGFVRAQNGGNSGAEPMNSALGTWGVLVKMAGVPEGGDEWLVFTDTADPQIRGLSVDMSTDPPTFVGWNFQPMSSCPW